MEQRICDEQRMEKSVQKKAMVESSEPSICDQKYQRIEKLIQENTVVERRSFEQKYKRMKNLCDQKTQRIDKLVQENAVLQLELTMNDQAYRKSLRDFYSYFLMIIGLVERQIIPFHTLDKALQILLKNEK